MFYKLNKYFYNIITFQTSVKMKLLVNQVVKGLLSQDIDVSLEKVAKTKLK